MPSPTAGLDPRPCEKVTPNIPTGQSQWRWSAAIGQWNLVGCNCSGESVIPPGVPGTYDGQLEFMECVSINSGTDGTDVRGQFARLAAEWKAQSRYMSNTAQMAMLRPYQRIIGLGPAVVPLILAELDREPNQWFWALEAITGEDPVPPYASGRVREMARAWVDWGRAHGLVSS